MKKPPTSFRGAVIRSTPPAAKQPAAPQVLNASPANAQARVRVGREVAGRGGKGVSVITGLPLAPAALEELATKLKKVCGAGGAVRGANIEIQGDHRDRLVERLRELGWDAKRSGG